MNAAPSAAQLEQAIARGDHPAVVALLAADAGLLAVRFPDNLNLTPLMWAARNRRESIVAELLARGADVRISNIVEANGDGGNTALWFAAQGVPGGGAGIVGRLLAAGADPDVRCEQGQTALFIAAAWVHLDVVRRLVDDGADPALADAAGRSPLQYLRECVAWCDAAPTLTADQQRFRAGVGPVMDFLMSLAPPAR